MRSDVRCIPRHIDNTLGVDLAEIAADVDHARTNPLLTFGDIDVPEPSNIQPHAERRTLGERPVVNQICNRFLLS